MNFHITVTFAAVVKPNDHKCIQVYNKILWEFLQLYKPLIRIGGNYYYRSETVNVHSINFGYKDIK